MNVSQIFDDGDVVVNVRTFMFFFNQTDHYYYEWAKRIGRVTYCKQWILSHIQTIGFSIIMDNHQITPNTVYQRNFFFHYLDSFEIIPLKKCYVMKIIFFHQRHFSLDTDTMTLSSYPYYYECNFFPFLKQGVIRISIIQKE